MWGGKGGGKIYPRVHVLLFAATWNKAPAQLPRQGIEILSSSLICTAVLPRKTNVPELFACIAHWAGFVGQETLNLGLQNA